MGYYDGNTSPPPPKKSGWTLPIVIGIIMGVLLMLVIYPNLVNQKKLNEQDGNEQGNASNSEVIEKERIEVDVNTQVTEIVDNLSATVVGITNIQSRSDFWMQSEDKEAGTGSGVIYKIEDGKAYVVTNHHVVNNADLLEVVLNNEETLEAEMLGSDLFTDLAVLRVDAEKVEKAIELGSSDTLKVGEPVIAIGNPLGHMFAGSVTQGIISGKQRTIPQDFNQDGRPDWQAEVIQTDAAINPGNSGGALINMKGQLIGINSMKISQTVAQGIGFAIPIDTAKPIIDELERTGHVTRPYIGVELYSLDEVPKVEWQNTLKLPETVNGGVYIWSIEQLSPASKAGLKRLDVITEFAGKEILNILDLRRVLYQEKKIGDEVDVVFYRDGEKHETTVVLTEQK